MQYHGGKARIAKRVAALVNAERGTAPIVEPFCGGAWMTAALGGVIHASDIHAGLIALYREVQTRGVEWLPDTVDRDEWCLARDHLPEGDSLRAFVGFGCSFAGRYMSSPAVGLNGTRPYATIARDNLRKNVLGTPGATFECRSFFDVPIAPFGYFDPPYAGTSGYGMQWDQDRFYARVLDWVEAGSVVWVSEYGFPFGQVVWEHTAKQTSGAIHGSCKVRTERLYRCARDGL